MNNCAQYTTYVPIYYTFNQKSTSGIDKSYLFWYNVFYCDERSTAQC